MSIDSICPVCLSPTDKNKERDYGDKLLVDCVRCGRFEVSGTALAMLANRLGNDGLARARLSHAIRLNSSGNARLFISSSNLDELIQQPLPGIQQQLEYLVKWLASQLGEDRFGRVANLWSDQLAGVIGAPNGVRVDRLIDYAVKQGLVERDEKTDLLGLSPEGWMMAEPPKKPAIIEAPTEDKKTPAIIIKAHCNPCNGERSTFLRATHTVKDSDEEVSWSDTYDVLECCGCHGLSVRHSAWFSEWDYFEHDPISGQPRLVPGTKISYWPPPTKRKKPEWADNLDDEELRRLFDEIYQALNAGLIVLASIGVRTLLDRGMFLRVEDPSGGFPGKLRLMLERGHIGRDEVKILEAITDAGNASAHRAYAPSAALLTTIIETAENFLHREFVLKTAAGEVRAATPRRIKPSSKRED